MIKVVSTIIVLLVVANTSAQKARKFSANIDFHINNTIYDRTASNNATGFGVALQGILNTPSKFSPTIEIAGDVYGGTKVMYFTASGEPIYAKSGVATVMGGTLYSVNSKVNVGAILGAGFFNDESYFAIKPSLNIQLFNNKVIAKMAWANIFQRDHISDQSFGYLSFGVGIKLF